MKRYWCVTVVILQHVALIRCKVLALRQVLQVRRVAQAAMRCCHGLSGALRAMLTLHHGVLVVQAIRVPDVMPVAPEGPRPVPSFAGVSVLPAKPSLYCSTMSQMSALSASCRPQSAGHPQVRVHPASSLPLQLSQSLRSWRGKCCVVVIASWTVSIRRDFSRLRWCTYTTRQPCPFCRLAAGIHSSEHKSVTAL